MIERTLTMDDLGITPLDVYKALNYQDTLPDSDVQQEVLSMMDEVRGFLQPKLTFVTSATKVLDDFQPGDIILRQLRGSEALCWFTASAGMAYEDYQRRLMQEGDMVRVYMANELGSLIAERVADQMELVLQEQLTPKGLSRTNRFSPGYCGWHVSEQRKLFSLFPTQHPSGITLGESCLMIPIKSVSGVIGIGHQVQYLEYTCGLCEMQKCYKNRAKYTKKSPPQSPQGGKVGS